MNYEKNEHSKNFLKKLSEPLIAMITLIIMIKDKRNPVFHHGHH